MKLLRLLDFLVEEWLANRGDKLTLIYIGDALKDETIALDEDSGQYSYPKTKANLCYLRKRLVAFNETEGYYDKVIIKLNKGSYTPEIAHNPRIAGMPPVGRENEKLIARVKLALDRRTFWGWKRAHEYHTQFGSSENNPRIIANGVFIYMALAPAIPPRTGALREPIDQTIADMKAMGFEPWESCFTEACAKATYQHEWTDSLALFERANTNSQGEAMYFWWYTALLASQGFIERAIEILDSAVSHFARASVATRTDLAMIQIMAGRYSDAEEILSACLDMPGGDSPLTLFHLAVLYEAQDRLIEMPGLAASLVEKYHAVMAHQPQQVFAQVDVHWGLAGVLALGAGRSGHLDTARESINDLLESKKEHPYLNSSVEIAIALIGLERYDDAVAWLRRAAFEEKDPYTMWFHIFPPLRHLRGHHGFKALLKALNLPAQRER